MSTISRIEKMFTYILNTTSVAVMFFIWICFVYM